MSSDEADLQKISRFISRDLDLIGKNAYSTWICKNQSKLLDLIWTRRTKLQQFQGGSTAEGTATATSDVDRMVVLSNIKVLTSSLVPDSDDNLFYMDASTGNPGYVRLAPVNTTTMHHADFGNFQNVLDECSDGIFLSSDKFVSALHSTTSPPVPSYSKYCYRHGPCLMVEHQNIYGYHNDRPGELLEADAAFALVCDKWPEEALEWQTRKRHHDWPNRDLVDKISRQDCHAVAVGDPTSEFRSLEWRVSFLLGERELVWNFNDTQIQCYIILKNLLKKCIDPILPDQLSSYHMKTLMFWLIEEEGLARWTDENLLLCIQDCLSRLARCIEKGSLQHYFHRTRNLLRYKLRTSSERDLARRKIEEINHQIIIYVINEGLGQTSRVHRRGVACHGNVEMLTEICLKDIEMSTYFTLCKKVNDTRRLFQSLFNIYANTTDCCDPLNVLLSISEELENNAPNDVDTAYLTNTRHFLNIRIGMGYYRRAIQAATDTSRSQLHSKCLEYFNAGMSLDILSRTLYLATFYYCVNDYSLCEKAVLQVVSKPGRYLYSGRCSALYGIEIEDGNILQTPDIPVTGEDDEIIKPVFDVVFSKEDVDFVPYAIKFDCALVPEYGERFFVFHPMVYAYGLLYFTHFMVGDIESAKKALKCLAKMVQDSGPTSQRYRALNLLGFCYSLNGELDNALSCYSSSLLDTAGMVGVRNAAVYHLAVLAFGVFRTLFPEREKPGDAEVIYKRK